MRVLFQGMRYDPTTVIYAAGPRVYSPTLYVWYQMDPIGFAGGTAVQTEMEGDNPVNETDPAGLSELQYMPVVFGKQSVYYAPDSGNIWRTAWELIGELDPKTKMVQRDGYEIPLADVEKEERSWFPTSDWANWIKNHRHARKIGQSRPWTANSWRTEEIEPGQGALDPEWNNRHAQSVQDAKHIFGIYKDFMLTAPLCATVGALTAAAQRARTTEGAGRRPVYGPRCQRPSA
jgi:RHS repeat-associated protein